MAAVHLHAACDGGETVGLKAVERKGGVGLSSPCLLHSPLVPVEPSMDIKFGEAAWHLKSQNSLDNTIINHNVRVIKFEVKPAH
jgi:hypothetical protein